MPGYIVAQTAGAFLGGVLVWLTYISALAAHRGQRREAGRLLHRSRVRWPFANLLSEAIATAALVIALLSVLTPKNVVPNSGFDC